MCFYVRETRGLGGSFKTTPLTPMWSEVASLHSKIRQKMKVWAPGMCLNVVSQHSRSGRPPVARSGTSTWSGFNGQDATEMQQNPFSISTLPLQLCFVFFLVCFFFILSFFNSMHWGRYEEGAFCFCINEAKENYSLRFPNKNNMSREEVEFDSQIEIKVDFNLHV